MEEKEAAYFFLAGAFSRASFLGRLVLAFITTSCSIFFRIPTSRSCGGNQRAIKLGPEVEGAREDLTRGWISN